MNVINVYVNDTCGYDIIANKNNISKEEIVDNFKRAYEYEGCKNITRTITEQSIKFTAKFDNYKDYNVIVPTSNKKANKEMLRQINRIYKRMQLKRKKINQVRMKKVFVGACIVLAGAVVIDKAPMIKTAIDSYIETEQEDLENLSNDLIKIDNAVLDYEYRASGAKNAHDNLEQSNNHEEAMEQYNNDMMQQRNEEKQEAERLLQQVDEYNQSQQQQMLEDIEQYRDFDTMPYVEKRR